jgi:hypothetical protein
MRGGSNDFFLPSRQLEEGERGVSTLWVVCSLSYVYLPEAPPLLGFCLEWPSNFVGSILYFDTGKGGGGGGELNQREV